jgi:HK97 family phage major capsid protein
MPEPTFEQKIDTVISEFADLREQQITPEKFGEMFDSRLETLKSSNAELVRKMQFGNGDSPLAGSKFSRLKPADIDWLFNFQTGRQAVGFKGPSEELRNAHRDVVGGQSAFTRDDLDSSTPTRGTRAMDTAESGYGSQLIGVQYVGSLWDVARDLGTIFPLFPSFEMSQASAKLPVEAGFPEVYYVGESTANNSSNYSTAKTPSQVVTVSVAKLLLHQMWSGELEEDSIIPFVPFLRMQAAKAIAYYNDSTVLNGDTTNSASSINDSSDPDDTKHFLAMDGIRHAALVDNTGNLSTTGGAITLDTFRAIRSMMRDTTRFVDWGHPVNRSELVFIADPDSADRVEMLDEVVSAGLMAGKSADLLNGQVASILGYPVIRTMVQKKSLATGFVHNSAGNSYGNITGVNVSGGVIGWRRHIKQEIERIPATDQTRIVYSWRFGFGRFTPTGAASGIEWTATATNLAV